MPFYDVILLIEQLTIKIIILITLVLMFIYLFILLLSCTKGIKLYT